MAAQARQLMLQLLDPVIALFDFGLEDRQFLVLQGDHRLQRSDSIGQIGGCFEHQDLYQNPAPEGIANPQVHTVFAEKYRLSGSERTPCPLRRAPVDPLQQHRQLRWCQRHLSGRRRGPYEPAFLQALGEQARALPVPPDDFDKIAATSAKNKQVPREWITLQHTLSQSR
jgi:hypothetical protein